MSAIVLGFGAKKSPSVGRKLLSARGVALVEGHALFEVAAAKLITAVGFENV